MSVKGDYFFEGENNQFNTQILGRHLKISNLQVTSHISSVLGTLILEERDSRQFRKSYFEVILGH